MSPLAGGDDGGGGSSSSSSSAVPRLGPSAGPNDRSGGSTDPFLLTPRWDAGDGGAWSIDAEYDACGAEAPDPAALGAKNKQTNKQTLRARLVTQKRRCAAHVCLLYAYKALGDMHLQVHVCSIPISISLIHVLGTLYASFNTMSVSLPSKG